MCVFVCVCEIHPSPFGRYFILNAIKTVSSVQKVQTAVKAKWPNTTSLSCVNTTFVNICVRISLRLARYYPV